MNLFEKTVKIIKSQKMTKRFNETCPSIHDNYKGYVKSVSEFLAFEGSGEQFISLRNKVIAETIGYADDFFSSPGSDAAAEGLYKAVIDNTDIESHVHKKSVNRIIAIANEAGNFDRRIGLYRYAVLHSSPFGEEWKDAAGQTHKLALHLLGRKEFAEKGEALYNEEASYVKDNKGLYDWRISYLSAYFFDAGNIQKASEYYNKVNIIYHFFERISKYLTEENYDAAEKIGRFLIDNTPNSMKTKKSAVNYNVGNIVSTYIDAGESEKAKELYRYAEERTSADILLLGRLSEVLVNKACEYRQKNNIESAKLFCMFVIDNTSDADDAVRYSDRLLKILNGEAYYIGKKYDNPTPEQEFFANVIDVCRKSPMMQAVIDEVAEHNVAIIHDPQSESLGYHNNSSKIIGIQKIGSCVLPDDVITMSEELIHAYDYNKYNIKAPAGMSPFGDAVYTKNLEIAAKARVIESMRQMGGEYWNVCKSSENYGGYAATHEKIVSDYGIIAGLTVLYINLSGFYHMDSYIQESVKLNMKYKSETSANVMPGHEDMVLFGSIPGTDKNFLKIFPDLNNPLFNPIMQKSSFDMIKEAHDKIGIPVPDYTDIGSGLCVYRKFHEDIGYVTGNYMERLSRVIHDGFESISSQIQENYKFQNDNAERHSGQTYNSSPKQR